MHRLTIAALCIGMLTAGCSMSHHEDDPQSEPQEAQPTEAMPEMAKLERLVGIWSGSGQISAPAPEDGQAISSPLESEVECEWTLGGTFLETEWWDQTADGQTSQTVVLITWDPHEEQHHMWRFSSSGGHGDGPVTFTTDADTLRLKVKGRDGNGERVNCRGTLTFVDDNTIEWTWDREGPEGDTQLKGTLRRQHPQVDDAYDEPEAEPNDATLWRPGRGAEDANGDD